MLTIENIIKEVDIFRGYPVKYELLAGGYVNKTYKTVCNDRTYCVRINNLKQAPFIGLDANKEAQALHQASLLSIAPVVYNTDNAKEYLITEFITGNHLSAEDMRNPEIIGNFTGALKLIHEKVNVDREFSIYDQFDKYIETAVTTGMDLPDGIRRVMTKVEKIHKKRSDSKLLYKVFCHNDTFQNNIIYDKNSIYFIDWEYCGYGDGFFDFAHIANCIGMADKEQQLMLKMYFGYYEPEMCEMLRQMKYISNVYDATWYIFHACLTDDEETKHRHLKTGGEKINALSYL